MKIFVSIQISSKVKLSASGIQSIVTRHVQRQENAPNNEGKNKFIETNSEMIQLIELVVKTLTEFPYTILYVQQARERIEHARRDMVD